MGSLSQRHLTWYFHEIAPILKEAERMSMQLLCCDAQRSEVLRAAFQEFRAGLLAGFAQCARVWDECVITEHRQKSRCLVAVRRVCLHLIKQLRKSR
jgi:hypothetical protein